MTLAVVQAARESSSCATSYPGRGAKSASSRRCVHFGARRWCLGLPLGPKAVPLSSRTVNMSRASACRPRKSGQRTSCTSCIKKHQLGRGPALVMREPRSLYPETPSAVPCPRECRWCSDWGAGHWPWTAWPSLAMADDVLQDCVDAKLRSMALIHLDDVVAASGYFYVGDGVPPAWGRQGSRAPESPCAA